MGWTVTETTEVDTTGVTGTVLRIEPGRNDWGGTTWTWTCPACAGVVRSHTSDKVKALEWIAKYAPHSHCPPVGEPTRDCIPRSSDVHH